MYNTMFLSFLQYGLIVWGQTYSSYIEPIFKLQNKAVRAISFQLRLAPSNPIFKEFNLLKLYELFELTYWNLFLMQLASAECFREYFLISASLYQYSTRQASQGHLYMTRKNTLNYGLILLNSWINFPLNLEITH